MGQAQINVRTRACSRTFIARTKQAALTHHVRGKELMLTWRLLLRPIAGRYHRATRGKKEQFTSSEVCNKEYSMHISYIIV